MIQDSDPLDLVTIRVKHAAPGPEPENGLALICESIGHFVGAMLDGAQSAANASPNARGPMDWVDPRFLVIKAATFSITRLACEGEAVTFLKKDREGASASVAVSFVCASPITRQWFLDADIVGIDTLSSLPSIFVDPYTWTPDQKAAHERLLKEIEVPYSAWDASVFQPAMAGGGSARELAVREAWGEWWRARIAPWWRVDVDPDELVRGFDGIISKEKSPKIQMAMKAAWRRAIKLHLEGSGPADPESARTGARRAAALEISERLHRRSGSVFIRDGIAHPNFRDALLLEVKAQRIDDDDRASERQAQKEVVARSALNVPGVRDTLDAVAAFEAAAGTVAFLDTLAGADRVVAECRSMSNEDLAAILRVSKGRISQIRRSNTERFAIWARRAGFG